MAEAPRFLFYWQHQEKTRILRMLRKDWHTVVGSPSAAVAFDVRSTPLAGVASDSSSLLGAVVHELGPTEARVTLYRHDPADYPTPVNQDDYTLWTDVSGHPQLQPMIAAASTEDNGNFQAFCRENVFFVKRAHGLDHWHSAIPSSMQGVLQCTSRST